MKEFGGEDGGATRLDWGWYCRRRMVVLSDNTVSKEMEPSSGTNETDGRFWRRVSETDSAVQSQ
jgi:hypothetical protein